MADFSGSLAQQDHAEPGMQSAAVTVALVNAMSDAALTTTERRFSRLLQSAFPGRPLVVRCVTLPEIRRGEMAAARIARFYAPMEDLFATPPDAVIFSGAEPVAAELRDEVFWPSLKTLFDWVREESIPSLFSCLAAHAAVLHYSGVPRRRLGHKKFGMFAQSAALPHRLLRGAPEHFQVAHSRWNELAAADLAAAGYSILTRGPETEVDMFVPRDGAPQIFLQGHPEYEESALDGEYRRDLRRFANGESTAAPAPPKYVSAGNANGFSEQAAPFPAPQDGSFASALVRNWLLCKQEMKL